MSTETEFKPKTFKGWLLVTGCGALLTGAVAFAFSQLGGGGGEAAADTLIVGDAVELQDEIQRALGSSKLPPGADSPAFERLVERCATDFVDGAYDESEDGFRPSDATQEKLCRSMLIRMLDDGDLSEDEEKEVTEEVLPGFCSDFILFKYDQRDPVFGDEFLNSERADIEAAAPLICADLFKDQ
jgi:hypothetical protein